VLAGAGLLAGLLPGVKGFLKTGSKIASKADSVVDVVKPAVKAAMGAETGANVVYRSVSAVGQTQYVGITNNLARQAAEHLAGKGIQIEKLMNGLSRPDARAVEQALIEIQGLGKNGGTLLNRINSIVPSNPGYAQQVQRGYELQQTIGY
jgi:hypothetical protein